MWVCCVAGEIVDPLTETTAPEVANSTEFAPEEGSPAATPSPATTEMVAAVGSEMSTTVHLPAALPLGDGQVPRSHSPTSAASAPWRKGLAPQMGFGMGNSPTATGVTAGKELAVSTEWWVAVSPSQQSSTAEASPHASQRAAALTNVPVGTAGQEQLSSPLLVFPNQTAFATTGHHTAFGVPQASSQGHPGTALPATGDAGVPAFNATLGAHVETGGENSSWSETYAGALGSPALPSASPAPSPTPGPAADRSEYVCPAGACTRGSLAAREAKPRSESRKIHSWNQWFGMKASEASLSMSELFSCRNRHLFS